MSKTIMHDVPIVKKPLFTQPVLENEIGYLFIANWVLKVYYTA